MYINQNVISSSGRLTSVSSPVVKFATEDDDDRADDIDQNTASKNGKLQGRKTGWAEVTSSEMVAAGESEDLLENNGNLGKSMLLTSYVVISNVLVRRSFNPPTAVGILFQT